MAEQRIPLPDDLRTLLMKMGPDAYALAWVTPGTDPLDRAETEPPVVGESGADRPGFDHRRLALEEVTRGETETLQRWMQLDDGQRQLAIIGHELSTLRESTPGELVARLLRDPRTDQVQLTGLLSSWLTRRNTDAPQGLELGWIAAAAAWTSHMRAFTPYPPHTVLSQSLASTGEQDEATAELVTSTAMRMTELINRLQHVNRPRGELVEDWHALEPLSADVPVLRETADWLLDQIALRDAHAQQLRAALEPDITDHLIDRQAGGNLLSTAEPVLDEPRTAHLAQARETVRAYTAAAHTTGRAPEAQQLLDTFPIQGRSLTTTGPAAAWRRRSTTAQEAVEYLAAQREASMAEDSPDYFADPELLHAQTAYLAAREGQLQLMHDALGRLADPVPPPSDLPEELIQVAAGQTQRRVAEAFGTTDRAREVLDGRIAYLQQEPLPAHRSAATAEEIELLIEVRGQLESLDPSGEQLVATRIRRRVEAAMARPAAPARPETPHSPRARLAAEQNQDQARRANPSAPGMLP
ncbi:hypothetical protein [Streptomyces sp900116325]|uniref:hypothetical protein n=1 Tax=Streptomyces sp. 900116325 TaxID=3154295 RepID=UPI0033A7C462